MPSRTHKTKEAEAGLVGASGNQSPKARELKTWNEQASGTTK